VWKRFKRWSITFVAGVNVVQPLPAHDYSLAFFLYPLNNHRTDEYGGSIKNRAKILIDVLAAIKKMRAKCFG